MFFSRTCNINSENIFIWKHFTYGMLRNIFCLKHLKIILKIKSLLYLQLKQLFFPSIYKVAFTFVYLTCAEYASNTWQVLGVCIYAT